MRRDFRVRLDDILDAIASINEYVDGMSFDDFKWDRKTRDAVMLNFEIIGEAANHIPQEIKDICKDKVEWPKIIGFRNIIVHEYFSVTLDVVWAIIHNKLPGLEESCRELLDIYGDEPFLDDNE